MRSGSTVSLAADGNTVVIGGGADDNGIGAVWAFAKAPPTLDHLLVYAVEPSQGAPKRQPFGPVTLADPRHGEGVGTCVPSTAALP